MRAGCVVDASALLSMLQGEPGSERMRELLPGGVMSAVNWSEMLQKLRARGRDPGRLPDLLTDAGARVVPFTADDAALAVALWPRTKTWGLSIGDRACLALALRLELPAVTTDRSWLELDLEVDVECIRPA